MVPVVLPGRHVRLKTLAQFIELRRGEKSLDDDESVRMPMVNVALLDELTIAFLGGLGQGSATAPRSVALKKLTSYVSGPPGRYGLTQ